ncbi:MAG TPA: ABC transporter substrate-binding protein [Candidatus Dormibacteraeota bacterium]|jgi:NitT/TauT family transport system substrate-binding protein|nr:ABC transporter substrate-binding protein [Candidatus Dormibacteraeota bacterium]
MRRVSILVVLPLVLAIVGLVVGLGPDIPSAQQPPQKVVFALNWFPVGDHAAYWVALEKGYYRQRGLDVDMQNSKGSGDSIAKVDTGRADVGLADSAVVIASAARGTRIKVVGMVFDKSPLNIWSRKEAPITKPKDLEGKSVAAPPGDGQRQMFPAFARLHGIDQSKVTWVNVEPAAKVPALAEKRVDAVADYTTGLPFYEKAIGKGNAVMLPWADHGFDMYSMSIIASEKTMKERGPVLKAFLEASYLGWRDVMSDPKSALEIFKKRVPEIDLSIIEPNMMMGLDLMKTDRYAKNGIGWMEEKKMCDSVDLVNTYMGVPTKVECKAVYTNEFLTRVELPRSAR